jgi:branched-chain amino acid aminotransferase
MTSWAANLTMLENARARGFDEVVLLDELGRVSECTSANIFGAREGRILTPPLSSGCLPGVTREILLEECGGLGLSEGHMTREELEDSSEVFITSTTRELLPVLEVEGKPLRTGESARLALQAAFSSYVDRYVSAARRRGEHARQAVAR